MFGVHPLDIAVVVAYLVAVMVIGQRHPEPAARPPSMAVASPSPTGQEVSMTPSAVVSSLPANQSEINRVSRMFMKTAPIPLTMRPIAAPAKLPALAVSTPQRAPALPSVPTVAEAGYPDAQYLFWGGVALPVKTPRDIVDRLHAETQKALNVPAVQERLATFGVQAMPMSVDQFAKFYRDDVAATVKLAKDINLVPTN